MDLEISDVAELLNVSEDTLGRWASEGHIPAYRLNQGYRFCRNEIEDWVIQSKKDGAFEGLTDSDTRRPSGQMQFNLFRAIHRGGVLHDVGGESKEEVIRKSMENIGQDLNIDAEGVTELLLDRERMSPTALGRGLAVPHTRDFLMTTPYDVVYVVFPSKEVNYKALDGEMVHTLFFLFACEDRRHLNLLAKLAHLAGQDQMREILLARPNKKVLLDGIRKWEGFLLPR